jgi:phosphatidylserine decarboxylase
VSPVDGKIISVDQVVNKYSGEPSYKIGIQCNKMGVFAIRSPIEGKLVKQLLKKDAHYSRYINWVQTDEGDDILWEVCIKGRTNAHCYVQPGERIGHGQRCGFIAFIQFVALYIPINSSFNVKIHEYVVGGETILASLVHNQGASIVAESSLDMAKVNLG